MVLTLFLENKNTLNEQKHSVNFDEAKTVFDDVWHSIDERRELIIGVSSSARLLIISFTERSDGIIRLISARVATTTEVNNYERTH